MPARRPFWDGIEERRDTHRIGVSRAIVAAWVEFQALWDQFDQKKRRISAFPEIFFKTVDRRLSNLFYHLWGEKASGGTSLGRPFFLGKSPRSFGARPPIALQFP